jgi:hypothetical protein
MIKTQGDFLTPPFFFLYEFAYSGSWWLKGTISEGFWHVNKTTDCDDLDLTCLVRYTLRCSFPRIFEAIGGLVQGFDGLFLCGDMTSCSMR